MPDWEFILRSIGSAFIVALFLFVLHASYKHLSNKYDGDAIVLIKVITTAVLIVSVILISRGRKSIQNELSKLSIRHIMQVVGVSVGIAIAVWAGSHAIEHEDIGHYSFTHTSLEILVAIIGGWILFSEKLNMGRIIGLACILLGVVVIGSHPI